MSAISKDAHRLGIFFFFDAEGIVDSYVEAMLDDIIKNFSELAIVVNGYIDSKSYAVLRKYSKNIFLRENTGFDVWAYKETLEAYGWDQLAQFDEVVLFNATIMGPVYPFKEMFDDMASRDIDFWGITMYHEYPEDPFGTMEYGYIPRHLQSHFHVYRKSLIESKELHDYWENMPPITSYLDSVGKHEAKFTKYFADLGFTWDVYVNTEDLEGITYQPILFYPKMLIKEKRCPIFKRRSFFHNYDDVLNQSVGEATVELYEYLRDETNFDTNLIWDNALRSMHMCDLVDNLKLNYILSDSSPALVKSDAKLALVAHIYYLDLLDTVLHYIMSMPAGSDIYLTVAGTEKCEEVRRRCSDLPYQVEVSEIENVGRDVSALLVGVKDVIFNYDYVCFIHDKKVTQLTPGSIGDGFAKKCLDNLLISSQFVSNVIAKFEQEPRLGMLMPSAPNHSDYFLPYSNSWGPNFENTKRLLKKIGVSVPLSPDKLPITPLGTMFWFRPIALKPLFDLDWKWEEFPPEPNDVDGTLLHAIERAYGFVAQSSGYFCAWLFSESFARIEITNLSYQLQRFVYSTSVRFGGGSAMQMLTALQSGSSLKAKIRSTLQWAIPNKLHSPLKKAYKKLRKII